jgi:hypothetical protein
VAPSDPPQTRTSDDWADCSATHRRFRIWITVIGGIVDTLTPLGAGGNRALHDMTAGTVVVRVR